MSPPSNRPHGSRALVAVVVLVPLLAGLALAAFAWPAARLAPRDLPIGVVAPAAAGDAIEQRLARDGDAVEVHRFADPASARAAIADRDVYGAIVVAPDGTTVLTASAASPLVAQLLQQAASALPAGAGSGRPHHPRRRRCGWWTWCPRILTIRGGRRWRRRCCRWCWPGWRRGCWCGWPAAPGRSVGRLVVASGAAGLVAVGVAQGWLGVLEGDWVVNAGVLGLTVLAVGGAVAGLAALFGRAGAALGALLMVLVGNPLSGVSSAPELLPQPAGAIGQLLPPGAGGSLLRSTAFFDGAGGTVPLAVLAAWVVLGLLLTWMAAARRLRPSRAVAPEADPVPVP